MNLINPRSPKMFDAMVARQIAAAHDLVNLECKCGLTFSIKQDEWCPRCMTTQERIFLGHIVWEKHINNMIALKKAMEETSCSAIEFVEALTRVHGIKKIEKHPLCEVELDGLID